MADLALIRVGVPRNSPVEWVWETLNDQPGLRDVRSARLYQPTRGFFEPTEWIYAAQVDGELGEVRLPGDKLPLRKVDRYPFRNEVNPYNLNLFASGLPMQLVTITVVPTGIEKFEDWYGEHADVLSRDAVGAMGALRYWQVGPPRRYASLYYYESEEGIEKYLVSDVRLRAAESRLPYDPWLVDQHHAYYRDITPQS